VSSIDIDPPEGVRYDGPLRFLVRSFSAAHESYMVELDTYNGNGSCACKWFECALGPLLSRMVTPEQAVAQGLVKLKPGQDVRDALRCKHIIEARRIYADDLIKAVHEAHAARAAAARDNASAA
jgi:hypothetical protein